MSDRRRILFGAGYTPQAKALFAAMSAKPTPTRMNLYNGLILSLRTSGLWANLDALYLMAAHDEQAGRLNIVAPSTFTLTGSPTFTTDRGFTGNGSSTYLETGFDPTVGTRKYTQDSAFISGWSLTNRNSAVNEFLFGGLSNAFLMPRVSTNANARMHSGNSISASVADSLGHYVLTRNGATREIIKNGVSLVSGSQGSAALTPAQTIQFLASSGSGFAPHQIASGAIGGGLTVAQAATFYTIINTYLVAAGAV